MSTAAYIVYRVHRDDRFELFYAYDSLEEAEKCASALKHPPYEIASAGVITAVLRPKFLPSHNNGLVFDRMTRTQDATRPEE